MLLLNKRLPVTRAKAICRICGREISKNNLSRHEAVCTLSDKSNTAELYRKCEDLSNGKVKCFICGRIFAKNGIYPHIWQAHTKEGNQFRDKMNKLAANSKEWKRSNGVLKAKELGIPWVTPPKTRAKLSEASKKQVWTDERRRNHRQAMQKAVNDHPQSYSSKNRGRVRQFICNGVIFQGKWELYFYEYCVKNSIEIVRNTKSFDYNWNGKRKYFPDFYLPELACYVEVKGYKTARDEAKWRDFPNDLMIITKNEIDIILSNKYIDFSSCMYYNKINM